MEIKITPAVYWHLQWLCRRTPCEVSAMGILSAQGEEIKIVDLVVVRQEVSPVHVNLDMNWWADYQVKLYEEGIEPWQGSCWLHTHPEGLDGPSRTDEETMEQSFGGWNFAMMLILTKDGQFYARVDFDHEFPTGAKGRLGLEGQVRIAWEEVPERPVDQSLLEQWEREFKERVGENRSSVQVGPQVVETVWDEIGSSAGEEEGLPWFEDDELFPTQKEESDYVEQCERFGLDPYDAGSYEAVYGVWPGREQFCALAL